MILYITVFCFLSLSFLFAEGKDNVLKIFPVVKVIGSIPQAYPKNYTIKSEEKFSAYSEITLSEIEQENPQQISELLGKKPGIYIKDYGGYGGIKTISLRGTSSQQTLVMIEGMRFNSVQNSSVDFAVLPVSMLNGVQILRGGTSSVFGGSSIGGTVNFNLKTGDEQRLAFSTGAGSFGEYSASLALGAATGNTDIGIAADYVNSKGNYPFTVNQFGETKEYERENADFENLNMMLSSVTNTGNWHCKAIAMGRFSDRGSPGPVLMGYVEPLDARLNEKEGNFILRASRQINNDEFSAGMMYRHNYQRYIDSRSPFALRGDTVSVFNTNDFQLNMRYTDNYSFAKIIYGLDGEYTTLTGDLLQPGTGNNVSRFQSGFYVQAVADIVNTSSIGLPFQLAGRYDFYTDVQGSPAGSAALAMNLKKININIKSQFSYNYRAPSFNEMYYLNYGTANLKPERSTSFNLSLQYEHKYFNAGINGFLIDTKDQIIAVPKSPLTWSAQNMASVFSRGVEFILDAPLFNEILHIGGSYTLQSVTDNDKNSPTYNNQVVYVPQEMLTARISAKYKGFYSGFNANYSGFTYYLPENVYSSVIPAYWLLNFNFSKSFKLGKQESNAPVLTLKFDILNMLDNQYMVIKNYPMPGRVFRLGLTFSII